MNEQEFKNHVEEGYKLIPITADFTLEKINPISIFEALSNKPKSYLFESLEGEENWSRYSIIGLPSDEYINIVDKSISIYKDNQIIKEIEAQNPIEWLEAYHADFNVLQSPDLPQFQGGLVGYFGFDSSRYMEPKMKFREQSDPMDTPDISLIISKEILIYDKTNSTMHIVLYADNNIESFRKLQSKLLKLEEFLLNFRPEKSVQIPYHDNCSDVNYHFDKAGFLSSVKKIKEYITAGDVMQVVLSQRMSVEFPKEPIDFYQELRKINPSPYMYYLNMDDYFIIGSSPEILVRLEEGVITVRPIAGTRPRGKDAKEDKINEIELQKDPKENAEHLMLIDLGRNDVGKVSRIGSVKLTDKMIIEKYSHVMHIVSNVIGEKKTDLTMFDVLKSAFPAGTVSGAPKIRAMEIIYELEPIKRGIYAGAVGYLGWNGNMDTAIAIRTCVIKNGMLNIQCGAGIVTDSVPENEWTETLNKGKAIMQAHKNTRNRKI